MTYRRRNGARVKSSTEVSPVMAIGRYAYSVSPIVLFGRYASINVVQRQR